MQDTKKIQLSQANYKIIASHIRTTFNQKFNNTNESAWMIGSHALVSILDHIILSKKSDTTFDLVKTEIYLRNQGIPNKLASAICREGRKLLNIHSAYYKEIEGLSFV